CASKCEQTAYQAADDGYGKQIVFPVLQVIEVIRKEFIYIRHHSKRCERRQYLRYTDDYLSETILIRSKQSCKEKSIDGAYTKAYVRQERGLYRLLSYLAHSLEFVYHIDDI